MANNNKKPTQTLRCGNIKAAIWQNVSENGPFFATTFSRPFKDVDTYGKGFASKIGWAGQPIPKKIKASDRHLPDIRRCN